MIVPIEWNDVEAVREDSLTTTHADVELPTDCVARALAQVYEHRAQLVARRDREWRHRHIAAGKGHNLNQNQTKMSI